jgi:prepilin-type N-terminal cleavage/methylation domain-containing protein
MNNKSGFSFIELLVTVTIVAVLMVGAVVSYRTSTAKARDSKRIGDMEQIRTALDMYRADYGIYPAVASGEPSGLTPDYISAYPEGPQGDTYLYSQPIADYTYQIYGHLDNPPTGQICTASGNCPDADHLCNYCVKNP